MVKNKNIYILLFFGLLSCKYSEKRNLSGGDTAQILHSIIESKTFVKENVCYARDSIFLLKTKYFNDSWPKYSKYFRIVFIDDVPQSKILNFGPNSPYDGRIRVSVFKFYQRKDTVSVLMLSHGPNVFFTYNLIKKDNSWVVIKEDFTSGGRSNYYGFEKDKWYLDLKKKIKPTKPLFPPTALKK